MKITTKWIEDAAVTKAKIAADVAGAGITQAAGGELDVNADGTTLEVVADAVQIKDLGVGTAKLAATSVTAAKLGSDVAGDGLSGGNGANLDVAPDATGGANLARAINVSANGVAVKIDGATITENGSQQLAVGAASIGPNQIDGTANYAWTGSQDMSAATSVSVPTPSNDGHAATKAYVDASVEGRLPKGRVEALADTNQTLSGLPTNIDGVTGWADNDKVLLIAQTVGSENGIWEVHAGSWTRPANFAAGSNASGASVFVNAGTTYDNNVWLCTSNTGTDVVDTDSLAWEQHGGGAAFTAGTGLTKNGNDVRVGDGSTGNIGGINRTADDIAVAVDNTSIEVAANIVQVKDLGVSTAKLAATSVTAAKLGNIAGNGLTGGSGAALAAQADATGGANLARAINVSANGIAVKVDDATITANASNQLIVKVDGIDKTKLAADVAGVGIAQAAGGELDLDINGLTAEVTVAADDYLAIWDTSASALRKMTRTNLLSGVAGENINQYMHLITAGEVTAGYLTLPATPVNAQSVRVSVVGGPPQVNKQVVGATGVTADFDVLNSNQVHINNNGAATGLSGDLSTGDVLIIEYQT